MAHYKFHNDCQSSVLTYEQVKRLDFVIDQTIPIHGRANYPTLYVKLKELIRLVKFKLQQEHSIQVRDVRLNGGASNYVLAPENSHYNDLDLIFGIDLANEDQFDVIRDVVLECLREFIPGQRQPAHVLECSNYDCCGKSSRCSSKFTDSASDTSNKQNNSPTQRDSTTLTCAPLTSKEVGPRKHPTDSVPNQGDPHENTPCPSKINQSASVAPGHETVDSGGLQSQAGEQVARSLNNQHQPLQMPLTNCAIKEAYVHKMVKVNDDDRWSLISLGVQPSESTCFGQINSCCPQTSIETTSAQRNNRTHVINVEGQQQFLVTITNDNNIDTSDCDLEGSSDQMNGQNVSPVIDNCIINNRELGATNCKQTTNFNQRNNCNHKQFPNSIELKFVDRMRRKFEFSVDSFQIILDSLIDFYDYAPQSSIDSQRILMNSHPTSMTVNTRPLMADIVGCVDCYIDSHNSKGLKVDFELELSSSSKKYQDNHNNDNSKNNYYKHQEHNNRHNHNYQKEQLHENISESFLNNADSAIALTSNSHRYYQLSIDAPNSQSIPSSSGCSSSSSVASSSSSLSSCDEDHDLCCEPDIPSSMSSKSTSSLISSPASFSLSLNGSYNMSDSLNQESKKLHSSENLIDKKVIINTDENVNREEQSKEPSSKELLFDKMNLAAENVSSLIDYNNCNECFKQQQRVLISNKCVHDLNITTPCAVISENFYPTVIGRSEYGNFKEALYHLEKKLIATRSPEEIRGGGLLKYCNLLVKNYKPKNIYQIRTLERYMCSRFFIDFSDLNQQQAKLESYLRNHFSDDPVLKFDYLTILHNVVQRSTVCLMNHELRLTLNMIRDLAYKLTTGFRQLYVNRM